jgi:hypothetical protein
VQHGNTILMTACLAADNETDAAFLQEHIDIVRGTNVPIYWVNVHCEQSVLEQRLTSTERQDGGKTKLTDVNVLRQLLREHRLAEPTSSDDIVLVVRDLDVTGTLEHSLNELMNMTGLGK